MSRPDAARALLSDLSHYCARTNMPETSIGHALFRHPGFVGLLRKRLQLSEEKEGAVRRFMASWPNGYHGELPHMFLKMPRVMLTNAAKVEAAPRAVVDRDPCPRCGTRGDIGCRHSRAPLVSALHA